MCTTYIITSNQKTTPKKKTQNTSFLPRHIYSSSSLLFPPPPPPSGIRLSRLYAMTTPTCPSPRPSWLDYAAVKPRPLSWLRWTSRWTSTRHKYWTLLLLWSHRPKYELCTSRWWKDGFLLYPGLTIPTVLQDSSH